jgi:hypothetical protein
MNHKKSQLRFSDEEKIEILRIAAKMIGETATGYYNIEHAYELCIKAIRNTDKVKDQE